MKEYEIRPQAIFDEYLQLAALDVQTYFAEVDREPINCPACGSLGNPSFQKSSFDYALCPQCLTLFVTPRPKAEAFSRYYTEAPSVEFWATTFYRVTAEARREKIWKPKAQMVYDALQQYDALHHTVIDIGGGYGIFAEEMSALIQNPVTVIEPSPKLAEACRSRKLAVVEKFLESIEEEDLPDGPKAFVSFELFEHLHNPTAFLKSLKHLMHPGDLFTLTTLSGSGVDIQVLWQDSKSIAPPHHLNFFNPHSIQMLLQKIGFEVLSVSTPGKLDIDILVNNQSKIKDRFWRTFLMQADTSTKSKWQNLIAASGWSSHMMVSCRCL
ncbi:MAG: class I SAM-dependent methyltransferase [Cyanobacteria bacterium J06635_15]